MGFHWYEKIVFKDGVDDGSILVMLLVFDDGFEDDIKYWFILGLFFDLKCDLNMVLKVELYWYSHLDVNVWYSYSGLPTCDSFEKILDLIPFVNIFPVFSPTLSFEL